ncbi:MAG: hypothetical protein U0641_09685 [Anaerolineae bacterium]
MYRVGLLVGRERSFPDALIAEVARRDVGVTVEYVKVGAPRMGERPPYDVIVDRISHEVPTYASYLKNAALQGVDVINNPFWRMADDKFFANSLADAVGVRVPITFALPNKEYIPGVVSESLRNLTYPLDWEDMLYQVGLPAILKPASGGGWRDVNVIHSLDELLWRYEQTGVRQFILQEFIQWDQYVRCLVVGKTNVLVTNWDPRRDHFDRYRADDPPVAPALEARCRSDAIKLNWALGYDMNTVEFGIHDGVPYAIDFTNSAPDFDISSLTERYFAWVVEAMADLVIERARGQGERPMMRWDKVLAEAAPQ